MTLIVINLALSFALSNISIGGHIGGLIGGILIDARLRALGKGHAAYGRLGVAGAAGLVDRGGREHRDRVLAGARARLIRSS